MKKKYTKSKSIPTSAHNTNTTTQNVDKDSDKALTVWLNFVKYSTLASEKHAIRMSLRSMRTTVTVAYNLIENCHLCMQAILLVCACLVLIFENQLKEYTEGIVYNIMMASIVVISINMWMVRFIMWMARAKFSSTLGEYIDNLDTAYDDVVNNYASANTDTNTNS